MRHIIRAPIDVPAPPPPYDRRRSPDRRKTWRGGRRDSDWLNRPPGALTRLEATQRRSAWRRALAVLHIW
jgi:hypothetical protein